MKTLICVVMGIVATLVLFVIVVWVISFLENIDIHLTNPIDKVADHAEETAKLVNAIRKGQNE